MNLRSIPLILSGLTSVLVILAGLNSVPAATTHQVVTGNNFFSPANITIETGDSILWTNIAGIHTTTSGENPTADGLWHSDLSSVVKTFTVQFDQEGRFPYFCIPHRFLGMEGTITVEGGGGEDPEARITRPTDGEVFSELSTVIIEATAEDSDGTVEEVEFLAGATSLGTDDSVPYMIRASSLGVGEHKLTAVATDDSGATGTSPEVTITVVAAPEPLMFTRVGLEDGSVMAEWSGGNGPFALQRRADLNDPVCDREVFVASRSAAAPATGSAAFIRAADLALHGAIPLTAWISGAMERPTPVVTDAIGSGTFALRGASLTFDIEYSGLSGPATAAHIHGPAPASTSAGVMINLQPFNGGAFGASGSISGTVVLTAEQQAAVLGGLSYVNIHTAANGPGEIRGQIAPVMMQASLSGAKERPNPVDTAARGLGTLALVGNQLSFAVGYSGLSGAAVGAHIHGPADEDTNAGVLQNLEAFNDGGFGVLGSFSGTIMLSAPQLAAVIDELTYINVHTPNHQPGEIRGQIVRKSTAQPLSAALSGAFERPDPVATTASGAGLFALEGSTLNFNIRYDGLSGAAIGAHIHGPASTAGTAGVLVNLGPFNNGGFGSSGILSGSVKLDAETREHILLGRTYVNIHTVANQPGEIRGQISPVLKQVALSGANERPTPVIGPGIGIGVMTLVGDRLGFNVTYSDLSGAATGAHIHGPASVLGTAGVLVNLEPYNGGAFGASGSLFGRITLTPDQLAPLIDGRTYINIHTVANGPGEIRGQIRR